MTTDCVLMLAVLKACLQFWSLRLSQVPSAQIHSKGLNQVIRVRVIKMQSNSKIAISVYNLRAETQENTESFMLLFPDGEIKSALLQMSFDCESLDLWLVCELTSQ